MGKAINHNHLYYFWVVGRHMNLTRAARELGLAQPTVSTQIRALESRLGVSLLARTGRNFELTEAGQIVFRHAEEMFRISAEIPGAIEGASQGHSRVLHVGTSDFVPKPIIRQILEPLMREDPTMRIICREWRIEELLAGLGIYHLDLVIADRAHPDSGDVPAISQPIMESPMAIYAVPALAKQLRPGFPRSLQGAPMLLPVTATSLRDSVDRWLESTGVQPRIVGEFEDRELLKTFGGIGLGAFPATALIEAEVRAQFGVERVGWIRGVRETYFALAIRRRAMHPMVRRLLKLK
ncbi:MAG: LysR family transcriptional regulator [Phycisphaerales bacterium]|nr:LysR family transcriptional regulator [Phycisphaerales bacterium]